LEHSTNIFFFFLNYSPSPTRH